MPIDLCAHCPDPGLCCRGIKLYSGLGARSLGGAETVLEGLVWLATVHHEDPWMGHQGLPFLPESRDADGGWSLSCPRLTPEGRCGDYENRPRLCRTYEPGRDAPCALTVPPPLPDPSNEWERTVMGEDRASRDRLTPAQRSRLMSRIRGADTGPERRLSAALDRLGVAHDRNRRDLPGSPDAVPRGSRVAVFVDGDFWHGWRFAAWRASLTPSWEAKIAGNAARDRRVRRRLRRAGWTVVALWEHQVVADAAACARRVLDAVRAERKAQLHKAR